MGFRTLVLLHNDRAGEWMTDPELGAKIGTQMNHVNTDGDLGYGQVVECTHADTETLAVIGSYSFKSIAYSHWVSSGQTADEISIKLLKIAAEKLGFRLVKKSK